LPTRTGLGSYRRQGPSCVSPAPQLNRE
jgi:hypothetical protein